MPLATASSKVKRFRREVKKMSVLTPNAKHDATHGENEDGAVPPPLTRVKLSITKVQLSSLFLRSITQHHCRKQRRSPHCASYWGCRLLWSTTNRHVPPESLGSVSCVSHYILCAQSFQKPTLKALSKCEKKCSRPVKMRGSTGETKVTATTRSSRDQPQLTS